MNDEMSGTRSMYGETTNAYNILVWNPEGKRLLPRPQRTWEDIKMDIK
jgi:hypothetical protein